MQLIPDTSARFPVRKPFDPAQNLRGGLAYCAGCWLISRAASPLVAAAYNAGEGTVALSRRPAARETRAYVRRIIQLFGRQRHPFDPSVTEPSPELPRISGREAP
jgi:soluble lytic murein transglycosylase-like protein